MIEKTVTEAINYRRSVRVYSDEPLDDAKDGTAKNLGKHK